MLPSWWCISALLQDSQKKHKNTVRYKGSEVLVYMLYPKIENSDMIWSISSEEQDKEFPQEVRTSSRMLSYLFPINKDFPKRHVLRVACNPFVLPGLFKITQDNNRQWNDAEVKLE